MVAAGCLAAAWLFVSLRLGQSPAPALAPELRVFWAPFLQRSVPTLISYEGTGAAGEYVTRADTLRDVFREMSLDPRERRLPLAFQVVVKARIKSGVPIHLSHVAHHVLAP